MPKKRRNQSRTLPSRQCKKSKIVTNSRRNRDGINYDENGYDLLDYLDESELFDNDESSIDTDSSFNNESLKNKNIIDGDENFSVKNTVYLSKRTGFIDSNTVYSNLRSKSSRRSNSNQNTEKMFVVEKILDMKKIEGNRQFLLKWEGYSEHESSWEPEDNIDSKDMIKEYLEKLQRMKKSQKAEKNVVIIDEEISTRNTNDSENGTVEVNDLSKSNILSKDDISNIESNECVVESHGDNSLKPEILTINHKPRKSRKKLKRSLFHKKKCQINKEIKLDLRGKLTVESLNFINATDCVETSNEEKVAIDSEAIIKESDKSVIDLNDDNDSPTEIVKKEAFDNKSVIEDKNPSSEKNDEKEKVNNNMEETMNLSEDVGSSQSNKENEEDDQENDHGSVSHVEDDNLDNDDDSESNGDRDEDQNSAYDPKSDLSDEEFNTESRKKSKTGKNNLNNYFPENLPQNVQEIFQVEKILRMRWNGGMRYFYLKWEGFPDTENSWEPEENLECPELIEEFLETLKKPKPKPKLPKKKVLRPQPQVVKAPLTLEPLPVEVKIKEAVVKPKGFPKDREPELILGSGVVNDELNFLIKWKNIDMANLVPAKRANIECPQVVIRFYENNLMWHNNDGSITTTSGDRITVSEENEEQKRQRIEAKREIQKVATTTPRKVGRPSSKSVAPGLIQSRKLTTGASRMLNLINNFQSNRAQPPVKERTDAEVSGGRIEIKDVVGGANGPPDWDSEGKSARSQSESVETTRTSGHDVPGVPDRAKSHSDPCQIPEECATKINLLSLLAQRPPATKPLGRPRLSTKPTPMPPCDSIDLTDDTDYQCQSVSAATRQYESRDLPSREPTPPTDRKFDFPKPNLHLPVVPSSSQARHQSPFYQTQCSTKDPCKSQPLLGPKLMSALMSSSSSSPSPSPAINHFKPLYSSQSYPNFSSPARAISPSPSLSGPARGGPDQRPLQQMMSLSLQQSFANSTQISPSVSVKQQLQHNLANNQLRTLAQYHNNTPTNDPSRQRHTTMTQSSFPGPASFVATGQSLQSHYMPQANIQYQSPLVPLQQLHQQSGHQNLSHQHPSHTQQGILYQTQYQSPTPYQYIVNGNTYQPVTNTGNNTFAMANNQTQVYYPPQNNSSSLRSILPRKPEYPSQGNQMSTMTNQQSQQQTEQSNQLLINSYLNLGAYL